MKLKGIINLESLLKTLKGGYMNFILKLIVLAIISMGISNTAALAYTCGSEPPNCITCEWQLDHCDTTGSPDFTSADSTTNPDNPCYPYCS